VTELITDWSVTRGRGGEVQRIVSCFVAPNIASKMTIDASTQADWKLLRAAFKGWRDDSLSSWLESRIDRRRLRLSFSFWMVRQRGVLLERVRDQRFLHEALEIWKERYEGIQEVLDSTLEIVETTRITKVLRSSLHLWKETLEFRRGEYELASVISPPIHH
jgi:hypothetical protein